MPKVSRKLRRRVQIANQLRIKRQHNNTNRHIGRPSYRFGVQFERLRKREVVLSADRLDDFGIRLDVVMFLDIVDRVAGVGVAAGEVGASHGEIAAEMKTGVADLAIGCMGCCQGRDDLESAWRLGYFNVLAVQLVRNQDSPMPWN